jgi:hypothetical protein
MSRILLVTQATRSYGEFRRPWVRALYRRYLGRYCRAVARAAARRAKTGELTVLTARELVDESSLPPGVTVRYYDEETFKVDSDELAELTRHLTSGWWPPAAQAPSLRYRGVWLPDLLALVRGTVLRLEIAEPLGIVAQVWDEVQPTRLVLLAGASPLERLARLLAESQGVPVDIAAPAFISAQLYALTFQALHPREERLRLREVLTSPRRRRPTAPVAARPILFVTCRPRHHFVVDPLVAAVRAAGAEPHVIGTPSSDPEFGAKLVGLEQVGIPWDYLSDFLPAAEASNLVRRYRPIFSALWRQIAGSGVLERTLAWRGLPLAGEVRPFLRDSVERTLLVALLYQEAAFRALDALRPLAVVVTSNRRYAERALALAARERGIPCLLFSGTLVMGRDLYQMFDIGNRMLVIGEHLREELVRKQGVNSHLISVIGDPRSNAARLIPPVDLRIQVFKDFRLSGDRPLLVLVSKYVSLLFSIQEKEAFYRTVLAAVRGLGDPHVIIKVHPNEDLFLLREQVRSWGWSNPILTKEYDLHRLFGAADAAVMVTSMAGVEAMAMGCPVVAVQTPGKDFEGKYMLPYVSEGAALRVDMGDPAALAETLRRLFADAAARADLVERGRIFAARYLHPVDGKLGSRLLDAVDEIRRETVPGGAR